MWTFHFANDFCFLSSTSYFFYTNMNFETYIYFSISILTQIIFNLIFYLPPKELCNHIVWFSFGAFFSLYSFFCMCDNEKMERFYLLVVKFLKIPKRISPSQLMWQCKIAFLGMLPNTCGCIKWVVICQTQCMIEESNIRSWQQQTSDAVDFVPSLTNRIPFRFVCTV